MVKVTIIISAYGLTDCLKTTLESVYRQTFKNWRCFLIADCCQSEFFKQLGQVDSRVTVVNLPIHCGSQYGPNSIGLRMANSKYSAFLNQDDLWIEDHLERAVSVLEKEQLDGYFARAAFCHHQGQSSWPYGTGPLRFSEYNRPEYYWRSLYGPNHFFEPASAWVVSTAVAHRVGDWISPDKTNLSPLMDWFSRFVRVTNKIAFGDLLTTLKINLRNKFSEEIKKPIYFRQAVGKEKLLELLFENKTQLRYRIDEEVRTAKERGLLVRKDMSGVLAYDNLEKKRQAIFKKFVNSENLEQFKNYFKNEINNREQAKANTGAANAYIQRTGQVIHKYPKVEQVYKFLLILRDLRGRYQDQIPSVRAITLSECNEWKFTETNLVHKSGRFFSIQIVESDGVEYIYINQPEVGILGFIIVFDGLEQKWLMQIKPEPGNVGLVQYAPTVQATKSNYEKIHNGKDVSYIDEFIDIKGKLLVDVCGSEQGDRFLNKFNRNMKICLIDKDNSFILLDEFKFFNREEIKKLLGMDYILNTDARSVIASGGWEILSECPEKIFLGCSVGLPNLGAALHLSMQKKNSTILEKTKVTLESISNKHRELVRVVPWSQSKTFSLSENGIYRGNGERVVGFYDCVLPNREIRRWQQPLLENNSVRLYAVPIKIIDGVAMLGVTAKKELGFDGRAEFTVVINQEYLNFKELQLAILDKDKFGQILLSIRQSDEGGRFWKNRACYSIFLIEGHEKAFADPDISWFTLGDLETLTTHKGLVTNEFRTIISLLLSLA